MLICDVLLLVLFLVSYYNIKKNNSSHMYKEGQTMKEYQLTKKQARVLLLKIQGLYGDYQLSGEEGVLSFIKQAGCIQFDPVDVCGKNPELVMQSRVKDFTKDMLYKLLYEDRVLIDYFDKNLSIFLTDDFRYFERTRKHMKERVWFQEKVESVIPVLYEKMKEMGSICSKDIKTEDKLNWYWGINTSLSRVALENLYFSGDLIIHHKKGTNKYYAPAKEYLGKEYSRKDPHIEDYDHHKWRVLRRIAGVGLLWNRPSDAWLGIYNLKAGDRERIFEDLLEKGKIVKIRVEGMREPLYCLKENIKHLKESAVSLEAVHKLPEKSSGTIIPRVEFLAPLDNMLWDRKMIAELFDFEYKWEIYTPLEKRKYGYYVLPILCEDEIIGRGEFSMDRKKGILEVKNIWFEKDKEWEQYKEAIEEAVIRFGKFNGARDICYVKDFVVKTAEK